MKTYRLKSMPKANCVVLISDSETQTVVILQSYFTRVICITLDKIDALTLTLHATGTYSVTTSRHINRMTTEFLGRNYYYDIKDKLSLTGYSHNFDWCEVLETQDPGIIEYFINAIRKYTNA